MNTWLQNLAGGDWRIVGIVVAVLLLAMIRLSRRVARWWRLRRPARVNSKLAQYAEASEWVQDERRNQAAKIIATSSTSEIAGYDIVEQVEAVYVDGFRRSDEATEGLKATAAMKGANAVINVRHEQTGLGKHTASGDAVVVRKLAPAEPEGPSSS